MKDVYINYSPKRRCELGASVLLVEIYENLFDTYPSNTIKSLNDDKALFDYAFLCLEDELARVLAARINSLEGYCAKIVSSKAF